ncbi:hypothetical protein BRC81_07375 [Halobacteriales archaeon QS_1_68_20]|nr:MAG: hypothetical protein BRC81_07375 [Halobacteriales archaeon QS_1_68_20]
MSPERSPGALSAGFGLAQASLVAALVVLFFPDGTVRTAGLAFAAVSGVLVAVALALVFRQLD